MARCDGCGKPPFADTRRWFDHEKGILYCANCVHDQSTGKLEYIFNGFDGDETCPSDPAFWNRIENMKVGDFVRSVMDVLDIKPNRKKK